MTNLQALQILDQATMAIQTSRQHHAQIVEALGKMKNLADKEERERVSNLEMNKKLTEVK